MVFCLVWNPDPQLVEQSLQSDQVQRLFEGVTTVNVNVSKNVNVNVSVSLN
jgi:hypothetical protein